MTPDPGDPRDPRNPGMNSQPTIPCETSIKKSTLGPPWRVIFQGSSRKEPQGTPRRPRGGQREPEGTPWSPKRAPKRAARDPKGPKRASRAQKNDKRSPMESQRDPKELPGAQQGVQRKPIYTKTPDQPHRRPLCYVLYMILYDVYMIL